MVEPELEILQPEQTDHSTHSSHLSVAVSDLPKVVVCFDINTLSHRKLKVIASDLKVPGYSRMTKAELCEVLLGL